MTVLLHVIIALSSIAMSGLAFVRPSRKVLSLSYGFIALTVGSGMYLVVSAPAHMIESCLMGMAYLAFVSAATIMARTKLARREGYIVTESNK